MTARRNPRRASREALARLPQRRAPALDPQLLELCVGARLTAEPKGAINVDRELLPSALGLNQAQGRRGINGRRAKGQ